MTEDEVKVLALEDAEARWTEISGKFILSSDDLLESIHLENRIDELVGPRDPRHRSMVEHDPESECITIYWHYPYDIHPELIKTPQDALSVVSHIARKRWQHATAKRVALLIDEIMRAKGWQPFGKEGQ